jgi:membrane protein
MRIRTIKDALLHFDQSDGFAMASHVALSLMIAIFPFLIFAVSLASIMHNDGVSRAIIDLVFEYWPNAIAEPIVNEIEAVVKTASARFLTLGILLGGFFASNGIEAVRVALNRAYGDEDERSKWKQRLQSLLFVVIGAILMLLLSILLVFLPIYFSFIETSSPTIYHWLIRSDVIRWCTAFGLLIFAVYACHQWLPGRRRTLARLCPGILLTLVLWVIVGSGFTMYISSFANYSATYAGLAGIMTALIFLYLMAAILIFGAEYNSALARTTKPESSKVKR